MKLSVKFLRFPGCTHRFRLCGLNLERFLNDLQKEDIPLISVSRRDARTLQCECYSCDIKRLEALADQKGWRMTEVTPVKLSRRLHWLRRRPGVPIGALIALVMVLTASRFVWRVEITGAGSYRADIAAHLTQSGYRPGILRSTVDARALEQSLLFRYPNLTSFQVRVLGMTLFVDVNQGVAAPPLARGEAGDLIARRGGVVTEIRVYAGTAQVKPGDVVSRGQVLIQGVERAADGETAAVEARGTVIARCWEQHTVKSAMWEIESEETGRQTTFWRIRTPFWLQSTSGADYLAYNTYVQSTPVGGAFFPVTAEKITQREVMMHYVPRDPAQVRREAAEAALKHLKDKHFGDEIIDKWVDYCMIEDGSLAATATVEWLMDIGGTLPP